ncbi:MAG: hypothetical protein H8E37_09755 [Planctomycetes bacterium]|nr:hypothetical protein [Planctomycetota bacterium]
MRQLKCAHCRTPIRLKPFRLTDECCPRCRQQRGEKPLTEWEMGKGCLWTAGFLSIGVPFFSIPLAWVGWHLGEALVPLVGNPLIPVVLAMMLGVEALVIPLYLVRHSEPPEFRPHGTLMLTLKCMIPLVVMGPPLPCLLLAVAVYGGNVALMAVLHRFQMWLYWRAGWDCRSESGDGAASLL